MTEPQSPPAGPSTDAERIARGQNVDWSGTYTHPVHGDLTFRGQLPTARQLLRHAVQLDEYLADMDDTSNARVGTMIYAAGLAGLKPIDPDDPSRGCLVQLPVVDERRDEGEHSDKVTRVYYDAENDPYGQAMIVEVWRDFSAWRQAKLEEVDAIKGSSGEPMPRGNGPSGPSVAPMDSPSTTPA